MCINSAFKPGCEMRAKHISLIILMVASFVLFLSHISAADQYDIQYGIHLKKGNLVLENDYVKMTIGMDGTIRSFADKRTGKDYLYRKDPQPLFLVKKDGKEYGSSAIQYQSGIIAADFAESGIKARIKVVVNRRYLTMELLDITDSNIEEFILARLSLTITDHIGVDLNVCRNSEFGVCLLALNNETESRGLITYHKQWRANYMTLEEMEARKKAIPAAILRVRAVPEKKLIGAAFALIAVPELLVLPTIEAVEIEQGLPHFMLGGVWGKLSPEQEKSYLFLDMHENNIEEVITYALAGGFGHVMSYNHTWAVSLGHNEINKENFPGGYDGLKQMVRKLNDRGLKAGLHMLEGYITTNDSYVQPIPDPRLRKDGERILASDINADNDFIPLTESPEGLPAERNHVGYGGTTIQIDNELIEYKGLSTDPPYGFSACVRGAYGTIAAPHRKGGAVYHIYESWGGLHPDPKTDLGMEIAHHIADIINDCGINLIYPDGYTREFAQLTYKFKNEVIIDKAVLPGYLGGLCWHSFGRASTVDFATHAVKMYVDEFKLVNLLYGFDNLLPTELGWWGYFVHSKNRFASLPDEIEYGYSKGVGYESPISLETNLSTLKQNGRTMEILSRCKEWETLRIQNYFSETVKAELRKPGIEHTLRKSPNGEYDVYPVRYEPRHRITGLDDGSQIWTSANTFERQPIKLRLRAECTPAAFGDASNIVLTDFADISDFKTAGSGGISGTFAVSEERVKEGKVSARFEAANASDSSDNWCRQTIQLKKPLDLLNNRGVGLWVYGDGSGAVLNIQLLDSGHAMFHDHYVTLNFYGWQYCELPYWEDDALYKFRLPYEIAFASYSIKYSAIDRVNIFLFNVPVHGKTVCYLSRIEALKENPTELVNPCLGIGNQSLVFPVTLKEDEYLEFWGTGTFKHFDPNGFVLAEGQPIGNIPEMEAGQNQVKFGCKVNNPRSARANVSLITMGEALENE